MPALDTYCIAPAGADGETGSTGPQGLSAYDIAINNGFVGSQQDWLNSLIGSKGQNGVTKSLIPYNVKSFEGYAYPIDGIMKHSLKVFGFGDFDEDIFANELGQTNPRRL